MGISFSGITKLSPALRDPSKQRVLF